MSADRIDATVRDRWARWGNKDLTHEDMAAGLRRAADRVEWEHSASLEASVRGRAIALAARWREEANELDDRADAERDPSVVSWRTRAATDPTLM
jgi:hypothetical protein